MNPDPHGQGPQHDVYTIHSLYLDTQNFDVLHRNGSFARGKYRIRRYGASDVVFLERKMKSRGLISKRRTPIPLAELRRAAEPAPDRRWPGFWYHRRLLARELKPVCQIGYTRTARMVRTETGNFRLTLDENISACPARGFSYEPPSEPTWFSGDRVILELKFRGHVPALAQTLIERFGLQPQPSSKYRIAGALLGFTSDLLTLNSALSEAEVEVPQLA